MKYNASITGKRLKKETRSSLVRIGKEVASLSEAVMTLLSTTGFVYNDTEAGKAFEIKVSRSAAKSANTEEEV